MKGIKGVIAVGLALAAIVTGIGAFGISPAAAAPGTVTNNGYKVAKFLVEVEGTQDANVRHTVEASGPCSSSDGSFGREHLEFHTEHPVEIMAYDTPGGGFDPEFYAGKQVDIPAVATITRTFTPVFEEFRGPLCEEENGGADPGVQVEETKYDCGTRHFDFPLKLKWVQAKREGLLLDSASYEEELFKKCPQVAGVESYPWLLLEKGGKRGDYITAQMNQKDLFDPDFQKWISLANGSKKRTSPNQWHKTSIHWSVSFTRLKE